METNPDGTHNVRMGTGRTPESPDVVARRQEAEDLLREMGMTVSWYCALVSESTGWDDTVRLMKEYEGGRGAAPNAATWTSAADLGYRDALFQLGLAHQDDPVEAYMWLTLAAHEPNETVRMARFLVDSLKEKLSAEQRAEGERGAEEWLAARVKVGNIDDLLGNDSAPDPDTAA